MLKKTLVLGASTKPDRYSNLAIRRLLEHDIPVVAVGRKPGDVEGVEILTGMPEIKDVHTITLYLNSMNQKAFEEYMLQLNPQRIIFNPGAENRDFEEKAKAKGIVVEEACTLVKLSIGTF